MRAVLLLALGCAACGDGSEGVAQRVKYERIAAARAGLYAVKASPGGAIAKFDDVRLIGKDVVCGKVDAQDGVGVRRFGVVKDEVTVEQPGQAATVAAVAKVCAAPGATYRIIGRNQAYTDLDIEDAL